MMAYLRYLFPALMVVGAVGSSLVEVYQHGFTAVWLQWFSAAGLYTALLLRNRG